jgi:hypothetical protein
MLVENMAKGKNIFMHLGFSSNVTLDMVALTNFVKLFNFCGRLYPYSLVAKPLSNLCCDCNSRVTTDNKSSAILIYWIKAMAIYTEKIGIDYKSWNEMKWLIKMGR